MQTARCGCIAPWEPPYIAAVCSLGRACCPLSMPLQCSRFGSSRRDHGCKLVPSAAPSMAPTTQHPSRQLQEGVLVNTGSSNQSTAMLEWVVAAPTEYMYGSSSNSSSSSSHWDDSSDSPRNSSSPGRHARRPASPSSARRAPVYVPIGADPIAPNDQSGQVYEPVVWQPPHQKQWEQQQRQQQQQRRRKPRPSAPLPGGRPSTPAEQQQRRQQQGQPQERQQLQQQQQQQGQRRPQSEGPQQQKQQQQGQQRQAQQKPHRRSEPVVVQLPDWLTVSVPAAPTAAASATGPAVRNPADRATVRQQHHQQQQEQEAMQKQRQQEQERRQQQVQQAGQQPQAPALPPPSPAQAAAAALIASADARQAPSAAAVGAGAALAMPVPAAAKETLAASPTPATVPAGLAAAAAPAPAAAPWAGLGNSQHTRSARQQRYRRTMAAPPGPLVVEEPALLALRGVSPEAVQAAAGARGRAASPGPGGGPLYPGRLTAEEEAELCAEVQNARKAVAVREALPPGSTLEQWAAAVGQEPAALLQLEERAAAAKQALLASYEGLIVKTAKYFASVSRLSWEELLVEARLGFLDAVAMFDPGRGARLSSIAPIRINFALNTAKQAESAPTPLVVPYAERHLQQRVVSLRGQLQATLGRKPSLKELAAAGGLSVERVERLLDMHGWQPLALEARMGDQEEGATVGDTLDASDTDTEGFTVAEGVGKADTAQQEAAVRQAMLVLLSQLSPRNRTALCMKLGLDLAAAEQLANDAAALEAAAAAAAGGVGGEPQEGSSKKRRGRPSRSLPAAAAAVDCADEATSGGAAAGGSSSSRQGSAVAPKKIIIKRDGVSEMTSREIGEHLGLTRQGVDTALATALKQLRSKLQLLEQESPELLQALMAPVEKGEVVLQLPGLAQLVGASISAGGMDKGPDEGRKEDVQVVDGTAGRKVRRGRPPKQ